MSTFDEARHPRGQAANRGQFRAAGNSSPTGTLRQDVTPVALAEVDAREVQIGDFLVVGSPYPTLRVTDGVRTFRTSLQTATVVDVERFGEHTEITHKLQYGTIAAFVYDPGQLVQLAEEPLEVHEITVAEARAIQRRLDEGVAALRVKRNAGEALA